MRRSQQAIFVGLLALAVVVALGWSFAVSAIDRREANARSVEPIAVNLNVPSGESQTTDSTATQLAPEALDGQLEATGASGEAGSAEVASAPTALNQPPLALSQAPGAPSLPRARRILTQLPETASTTPGAGAAACPSSPISVSFNLTDAMRSGGPALDPNVVWMTVDGVDVAAEVRGTRDFPQSWAELVYTPSAPLAPGGHEAWVNFPSDSGEMLAYSWSFEASDAVCAIAAPAQPAPEPAPPAAPPAAPAPPAAQPGGPPPPPVAGNDVLHFRAERTAPGPQGQSETTNIEFWFDPTNFGARLTERGGQADVSTVCAGREVTTFLTSQKRAETQVIAPPDAPTPILCPLAADIFEHKMAMDAGAVTAADADLEGVAASRIESTAPDGSGRIEVYLEKTHGLLLRETVFQRNEAGTMAEVGSTRVRYSNIERISRASAPADTFSNAVASDWIHRKTRPLSEAEARGFSALQLQWLGPDFSGMGLRSITHEELSGPPGRLNTVTVEYAQAPDPNNPPNPNQPPRQLQIFQAPPAPGQGSGGPGGPGGAPPGAQQPPQPRRENITIGGRQATLITVDQGPTIVEMTLGNTFIAITGPDRATVTQAAQNLQRLG
jgi:hypothetical protein